MPARPTGFTSETHTFQWDGGTTGAPNAKGRLAQVVDLSGTTKWSYTPQGRASSPQWRKQEKVGSDSTCSPYDGNGNRLTATDPLNRVSSRQASSARGK